MRIMPPLRDISVLSVSPDAFESHLDGLTDLLHACVHGGASINFVLPFSRDDSAAFWRQKVLPALSAGTRTLLIAHERNRVAGSVQLDCDTPPNQPHRAEITKLMVHPDDRRRGIARALMAQIETVAKRRGRRLITLDTRTGDAAEPLYQSLGYHIAGIIPDYCRDPFSDRLDATTIMHKSL